MSGRLEALPFRYALHKLRSSKVPAERHSIRVRVSIAFCCYAKSIQFLI